MADDEAPAGVWLAQYATWPVGEGEDPQPMPDTHKHWAETGSPLEASLRALGYVAVEAPGAEPIVGEHGPELEVPAESGTTVPAAEVAKVLGLPKRRR